MSLIASFLSTQNGTSCSKVSRWCISAQSTQTLLIKPQSFQKASMSLLLQRSERNSYRMWPMLAEPLHLRSSTQAINPKKTQDRAETVTCEQVYIYFGSFMLFSTVMLFINKDRWIWWSYRFFAQIYNVFPLELGLEVVVFGVGWPYCCRWAYCQGRLHRKTTLLPWRHAVIILC